MCRGGDSLQRPDGPATSCQCDWTPAELTSAPDSARDASMGNQSAGGIRQGGGGGGGGGGLDLLGVINMIQIFTLPGHLAECRGRPASCSQSETLTCTNVDSLINTFAHLRMTVTDSTAVLLFELCQI